ncbi:putative cytochrome P450 [Septoria linicola]|nr:putative cytochrome P450 [Septoria linicola]
MALLNSGALVGTLAVLAFLHLSWRFVVYPRFASPLRHIPAVYLDWRTRLYRWIYVEPTPDQVLTWLEQTPKQLVEHGIVRYPGIGGQERVLLVSPEALREVLEVKAYNDFQKPLLNRQRLAMFGNGLLASDGTEHHMQRKKMLPAFAPRIIRALVPFFWAKASELVNLLERHVGQGANELELAPWTSRASLDVIGVAAWGRDFGALENPRTEVVSKYHRIFRGTPRSNQQAKLIYAAGLVVPLSTIKRLCPCEFFTNLAVGTQAIRQAATEAIAATRSKEPTAEKQQKDILTQAMSSGSFDDAALVGQMLNVLAAGHETSSLSVTWACWLLAKHPAEQDRLRAEVRSSLPSPTASDKDVPSASEDVPVTAESLEGVRYLQAVMKEALRLVPPAPVTRREAKRDTTILGATIPNGTAIIALHKHFNTLPSIWGPDAK